MLLGIANGKKTVLKLISMIQYSHNTITIAQNIKLR
jgi:hypothetical protein